MRGTAAVITVSDKGFRGERTDTSGPAVRELLEGAGFQVVHTALVPDEEELIREELKKCADDLGIALVATTGGTGFSPRDVTPEATLAVCQRLVPGLPEEMRRASMEKTSRGCLSRAAAGIRGRTLIVNLPGSDKAARENLTAILEPLSHGMDMLLSRGSADCAAPPEGGEAPPSLDRWLSQAKAAPGAERVGTYLTHVGVVRATARAQVRQGEKAPPVTGMVFSYDPERTAAAVEETRRLPGVSYVRAWLNRGRLRVGDELMYVLVGADIRPHGIDALQFLVGKLKTECVKETELH